jgi:hypothetical protein
LLFEKPNRVNKSYDPYTKHYKGSKVEVKSKIIFEQVSKDHLAIAFKNCYSSKLVDSIKKFRESKYQPDRKVWILPTSKKQEFLDSVTRHCLDEGITIVDVPEFVMQVLNSKIGGKLLKFDFQQENKSVESLPDFMLKSMY